MAEATLDLNTTDPVELAKAFEQLESGTTPEVKTPEPAPDPAPDNVQTKETKQPDQPADTQGQQDQDKDPDGVLTKDGKHVIPYSVLKSERDRASRAEQLAREAAERVAALEAQVKQATEGAKTGESARTEQVQPNVSDLSAEDLEALKEDFPTVYKGVMAAMSHAKALEAKLSTVEQSVRNSEATQARSAQETVQDAIDSVPKMAHIQATNPEAFDLAKQFDASLKVQAKWADKPLTERFAKVAEMVEAALGPIELPGQQTSSQPSAVDLKAAAKAKADAAAKASRTAVPTSLSEFPAGQHAAQDEREAAESMTHLQLAEKFSRMSADEQDAYFRTL